MPPENGVRRDDRRHLREDSPAEALANDRETSSFAIAPPHPAAV
jgi:hypothetical protein